MSKMIHGSFIIVSVSVAWTSKLSVKLWSSMKFSSFHFHSSRLISDFLVVTYLLGKISNFDTTFFLKDCMGNRLFLHGGSAVSSGSNKALKMSDKIPCIDSAIISNNKKRSRVMSVAMKVHCVSICKHVK